MKKIKTLTPKKKTGKLSNAGRKPIYAEPLERITGRIPKYQLEYLRHRPTARGVSDALRQIIDKDIANANAE